MATSLADEANIATEQLLEIEAAVEEPTVAELIPLAAALGISSDEFLLQAEHAA
jgi:transcriptional regulator with XRE-family HTH domain